MKHFVLCLDASSSCTGYSKILVDGDSVVISSVGCIWFGVDWDHGQKYNYLYDLLHKEFSDIGGLVVEQYSVNMTKGNGILVSPELHGIIKLFANQMGIKMEYIAPQTWRSVLGIKAIKVKNKKGKEKRDFKVPTAEYVSGIVNIPETMTSNITKKERQTPNDVTDAIALSFAWVKRNKLKIVDNQCQFNDYIKDL
jgi:Holliday junction resolvasome RuvABC endonuclease subunit